MRAVGQRYRRASKVEELRIFDEFVANIGFHRKRAIRVLNKEEPGARAPRSSRVAVYDAAVKEALVVLWEASDRICGKRLKPLLAILVAALERHKHLQLDATVRTKLLKASASTIVRLLREPRTASDPNATRKRAAPAVPSLPTSLRQLLTLQFEMRALG